MHTLIALLVTVVGSGGPAPVRGAPPSRLQDATVVVTRHGHVVARSRNGRLGISLPPGDYAVRAGLGSPNVTHPGQCQARTVRLNRGTVRVRVTLACSIK